MIVPQCLASHQLSIVTIVTLAKKGNRPQTCRAKQQPILAKYFWSKYDGIISRFDVKMTAHGNGVIGGHFYIFFE